MTAVNENSENYKHMIVMDVMNNKELGDKDPLPIDYCFMQGFAKNMLAREPNRVIRRPGELDCEYFVRIAKSNLEEYIIYLFNRGIRQSDLLLHHNDTLDYEPTEYIMVTRNMYDKYNCIIRIQCGVSMQTIYFVHILANSEEELPEFFASHVAWLHSRIREEDNSNISFDSPEYQEKKKKNFTIFCECTEANRILREEVERERKEKRDKPSTENKELEKNNEDPDDVVERPSKRRCTITLQDEDEDFEDSVVCEYNDDDIDSNQYSDNGEEDDEEENDEEEKDSAISLSSSSSSRRTVTRTVCHKDGSITTFTYTK